MHTHKEKILIVLLAIAYVSEAFGIQIGPEIRIGPGEATIGGVGVKDGKPAAPTVDQMIDTAINSTPLVVLSDADKNNIKGAIKTTGIIAAVASDPISGLVILTVIGGDGSKKDIPVPTTKAPPTGKSWSLSAKCIVQQGDNLFTAMFDNDPPDLQATKDGDTIVLTASYCDEYKQKSVTAVTVIRTGLANVPDATPPAFRHYLVGRSG